MWILSTPGSEAVAAWAARLARALRARTSEAPAAADPRTLLDLARKREPRWLVCAPPARERQRDFALLLGGAPCPVLTVPAWAPAPRREPRLGVVGVDGSAASREAALAAASLLATSGGPSRLILVHGCPAHPAELAAHTAWSKLADGMRAERHAWLGALAEELRAGGLLVETVARLVWAPDLIAGLAQQRAADFAALGVAARGEGDAAPLGGVSRRVLRGTPCPTLTATPR